jgi:hypothetical protein
VRRYGASPLSEARLLASITARCPLPRIARREIGKAARIAVILFNVAALKVLGAVFVLGAVAWVAHALGR